MKLKCLCLAAATAVAFTAMMWSVSRSQTSSGQGFDSNSSR